MRKSEQEQRVTPLDNMYKENVGSLDQFYDDLAKPDKDRSVDFATCIFRFVRCNHSLKSVSEMANEILLYGWCDTYESAEKAIRANLLFDDNDKCEGRDDPPSLFDHMKA